MRAESILNGIGANRLLASPDNALRVLAYHDIKSEEGFEWQVRHLTENYQLISPQQLEGIAYRSEPIPPRAVLITFDDAYPSVMSKGKQILNAYKAPAIVFAITSLVGTDEPYWWDEIAYYAEGSEYGAILKEAKTVTDDRRRRMLLELRAGSAKTPLSRRQLSWDELTQLEASGILIGNHTHTHPLLDNSTHGEIDAELKFADRELRKRSFEGAGYFAYPNGNFSDRAEKTLREIGVRLAFLFDHQINQPGFDPLRISRLSVNTDISKDKFKLILSGAHSKLLNFRKAFL